MNGAGNSFLAEKGRDSAVQADLSTDSTWRMDVSPRAALPEQMILAMQSGSELSWRISSIPLGDVMAQ